MTKILSRSEGQKSWQILDSRPYEAEAALQKLLAESPSLIPLDEVKEGASPLIVAVAEFGLPGSGNTDLLAFSADGDVAIVECKLDSNQEIKRKVVGQILEYGAYLWGTSYEEVDQRVIKLRGKSLTDLVGESVGVPDWDERSFRTRVARSLADGTLILIVAVDAINEELGRTIRFLNGCGKPAFSMHALEVRRFQTGGLEVLIPHLHGDGAVSTPPAPRWTKERFWKVVREGLRSDVAEVVEGLLKWSESKADNLAYGRGTITGSFTFQFRSQGKTASVFTVTTDGKLWLNYSMLREQMGEEMVKGFPEQIHKIEQFGKIDPDSKNPSVKIADVFVRQPGSLDAFKERVIEFGNAVHSRG